MLHNLLQKEPDPREITNEEGAGIYREHAAIFVDVREPDEWAEGHMPGAIHIPLGDLAQRLKELPGEKPIVTVCRSGKRSLVAVDILEAAGRSGAKSLAGGMLEWKKQGLPIE